MAAGNLANITQVIRIPPEEFKFDLSVSGKLKFKKLYQDVVKNSEANVIRMPIIEKQSMKFVVTGKQDEVLKTRNRLLVAFQTQTEKQVRFPKELHRWILDAQGQKLRELESATATKIQIPSIQEESEIITITGTKKAIETAELSLKSLFYERVIIVTDEVVIPTQLCNSLKRTGRKLIRTIIEDCGGVTIKFPTAESNSNKVTISGSKNDVEKAKQQLLDLCKEKLPTSFSAEVRAEVQHHEFHIGKNSANINKEQKHSMVLSQVPETQSKNVEIYPCESLTSLIDTDIIGCKGTDVEKGTQSTRNIYRKFTYAGDDINISHPTEKIEEVQTEIQKLNEKLNISRNSISLIREQTDIVTDALTYYSENRRDRLTELHVYKNIILKQERKMKELRDQLNDQVSMNKAFEIERTQLVLENNNEREKCEKIIHENQQKYDEQITKMSVTIKEIKADLKMEREEKFKLIVENNENLNKFEELSKNQALQNTSTEYPTQIELLKFSIKALKKKEARLNDELKNKDEKISKLNIDLNDALKKNTNLSNNIQSLNRELHNAEERIRKAKKDFKTYSDDVDEHAAREKAKNANNAAELNQIKSNVYDLKEKLAKLCEMLKEAKNASSMQSAVDQDNNPDYEDYQEDDRDCEDYQEDNLDYEDYQEDNLDYEDYQEDDRDNEDFQKDDRDYEDFQKDDPDYEDYQEDDRDYEDYQEDDPDYEIYEEQDLDDEVIGVFCTKTSLIILIEKCSSVMGDILRSIEPIEALTAQLSLKITSSQ